MLTFAETGGLTTNEEVYMYATYFLISQGGRLNYKSCLRRCMVSPALIAVMSADLDFGRGYCSRLRNNWHRTGSAGRKQRSSYRFTARHVIRATFWRNVLRQDTISTGIWHTFVSLTRGHNRRKAIEAHRSPPKICQICGLVLLVEACNNLYLAIFASGD